MFSILFCTSHYVVRTNTAEQLSDATWYSHLRRLWEVVLSRWVMVVTTAVTGWSSSGAVTSAGTKCLWRCFSTARKCQRQSQSTWLSWSFIYTVSCLMLYCKKMLALF